MKIGFDAKRAFYNYSGLGNYSRSTIGLLTKFYPKHDYFLYTPSTKDTIEFLLNENTKIIEPQGFINSFFKSYWRSFKLSENIKKDKLDVYHGLSNELPQNAHKTGAKIFVTVHDLIFIRYPELYHTIDRKIYHKKFKYACEIADTVISISKQTKTDLVNFLYIDKKKIEVVYQGCNPIYYKEADEVKKIEVTQKYNLPKQYILNVGTVEKRKNVLSLVKALKEGNIDIPLIIVGGKAEYQNFVEKYIFENRLENQIVIYNNVPLEDLPALYQLSELFVYLSLFEGFGIPILEALNSKVPVITTKGGCFSEAGGFSSIYVSAENIEEIQNAIKKTLTDSEQRIKMINEGFDYAQNFKEEKIAERLMNLYLTQELKKTGD